MHFLGFFFITNKRHCINNKHIKFFTFTLKYYSFSSPFLVHHMKSPYSDRDKCYQYVPIFEFLSSRQAGGEEKVIVCYPFKTSTMARLGHIIDDKQDVTFWLALLGGQTQRWKNVQACKQCACKFCHSLGKICGKFYAVWSRKWLMLLFCVF